MLVKDIIPISYHPAISQQSLQGKDFKCQEQMWITRPKENRNCTLFAHSTLFFKHLSNQILTMNLEVTR
jgi:hypothetical protein